MSNSSSGGGKEPKKKKSKKSDDGSEVDSAVTPPPPAASYAPIVGAGGLAAMASIPPAGTNMEAPPVQTVTVTSVNTTPSVSSTTPGAAYADANGVSFVSSEGGGPGGTKVYRMNTPVFTPGSYTAAIRKTNGDLAQNKKTLFKGNNINPDFIASMKMQQQMVYSALNTPELAYNMPAFNKLVTAATYDKMGSTQDTEGVTIVAQSANELEPLR